MSEDTDTRRVDGLRFQRGSLPFPGTRDAIVRLLQNSASPHGMCGGAAAPQAGQRRGMHRFYMSLIGIDTH